MSIGAAKLTSLLERASMLERAPPSNKLPPFDMKYLMSAALE